MNVNISNTRTKANPPHRVLLFLSYNYCEYKVRNDFHRNRHGNKMAGPGYIIPHTLAERAKGKNKKHLAPQNAYER